jgi:hypothetical protein
LSFCPLYRFAQVQRHAVIAVAVLAHLDQAAQPALE